MNRIIGISLTLLLTYSLSCSKQSPSVGFNSNEKDIVIQEIENAVWEFYSADTAMNSTKVMNLLWPECSMLIDGNRISYTDISKGSKEFMGSLVLFHTEWQDLQIIPISQNVGVSSFIFKDSIINESGVLTQAQGPNTFVWQKRDNEWKVLYGDADHYPVTN